MEVLSAGWDLPIPEEYRYDYIKLARRKVHLSTLIFKYNIAFSEKIAENGWTHSARCPFPDHNDTTPSFSYNSKDGIFHCFGCNRHGGSVDFLSYLKEKPPLEIAKELLKDFPAEYIQEEVLLEDQTPYYQQLTAFNQKIHEILQKDPTQLANIEKITWNLDCYTSSQVMHNKPFSEELTTRLTYLEEYLDLCLPKL